MECALQGWFHPHRISPTQIEALQTLIDSTRPLDIDDLQLPDGFPVHSALISLVCNLRMAEEEARSHWEAIALHREELSWRLGRDPGIRVAAMDHFVNRECLLSSPKMVDEGSFERTARSAEADGVTGLLGERAYLAALRSETRRARRNAQEFVIALLNLDDFAGMNSQAGRRTGDAVLRETAMLIRGRLRDMDLAARPEGGVFALLLPLTRRMGGYVAVDRIRSAVSEGFLLPGLAPGVSVSLSAGLAAFPEDGDSALRLLDQARTAVRWAEESGGNRVVMRTPERRSQVRYRPMGPAGGICADFSRGHRSGQVRVREFSAAGALLEGIAPAHPGEMLELRLEGAAGESLLLEAQVVWESSPSSGEPVTRTAVRFLPRSGEYREALERWAGELRLQGVE